MPRDRSLSAVPRPIIQKSVRGRCVQSFSRYLFRHQIHPHLRQIQVGADPHRGRDARDRQHLPDDLHGQTVGHGHARPLRLPAVHPGIGPRVHEALVDGVDVDVVLRHVPAEDLVDLGGYPDVFGHAGRRGDVVHLRVMDCLVQGDGLLRLEQPGTGGDADGLQRRGDRQHDGLVRAGVVRHQKPGRQGIQPPRHALHRSVEGLHVAAEKRAPGFHTALRKEQAIE